MGFHFHSSNSENSPIEADGDPVCEQFLHDGLCASQHEVRVFGAGDAGDVSDQQLVQHGGQVLHVGHQDHRHQGRHRHSEKRHRSSVHK